MQFKLVEAGEPQDRRLARLHLISEILKKRESPKVTKQIERNDSPIRSLAGAQLLRGVGTIGNFPGAIDSFERGIL